MKINYLTTKYLYIALKGFLLLIVGYILYQGRDTFYRFCRYPVPFILCPICEYPCFFKGYQKPLAMGILITGLFKGRIFCGLSCPVGTTQDVIYLPASNLYKKINAKNTLNKSIRKIKKHTLESEKIQNIHQKITNIPLINKINFNHFKLMDYKGLRLLKYLILIVSLVFSAIIFARVYNVLPDWLLIEALRFTIDVRNFAGPDFKNTWYIFLLFVFVFGIFVHRAWCKYLCPAGLLFALTNKFSIFKIKVKSIGCTGCKDCLDGCTTGYPYSKLENGYDSLECVRCDRCIIQCKPNVVNVHVRDFKSK